MKVNYQPNGDILSDDGRCLWQAAVAGTVEVDGQWVSPQYDNDSPLIAEAREFIRSVRALQIERREAADAAKLAAIIAAPPVAHRGDGLCPKCHTYCDGDCEAVGR